MAVTSLAAAVQGPYAFILLEVLIIGLQVLIAGFPVGSKRKKYFNKEFFERHFPELKGKVPQGGYPDMGSGRYASKLTLEQWQDFNHTQRGHLNYVEGAATAIVTFLVAGLFQPRLVIVLAAIYIIGRVLYAAGYSAAGPKGRLVGTALFDIALLGAFGVGAYSAFVAGGGLKGLMDVVQHVVTLNLWQ